MLPPQSFQDSLDLQFDRQIRVRWSPFRRQWLVERKAVRGLSDERIPPELLAADPDRLQQMRDGFYPIFRLAPGDRAACPHCGAEIRLAVREFRQTPCGNCRKAAPIFFFPLGDDLLQHLRWSDPDRGGTERAFRQLEADEAALEASRRREQRNLTEAVWKEDFGRVFEIPQFGYSKAAQFPWTKRMRGSS